LTQISKATWLVLSLHGSLRTSLRKGDSTPKYLETTYKQNMWRSMPVTYTSMYTWARK